MLLRLDVVEEIGRFAKLNHYAEQFSRLSLVFARNALGKSTLCAILRSASEGQARYISARRRLDATKESRVQTKWSPDTTLAFGGGKWNGCPGKIYVFDQEFINQNLHVGESVTRDNKRSLLPVILGEHAVGLANKVTELDKEQRELDKAMRQDAAVIYAKCPVVTAADLVAFCTKQMPDDVDQRVITAEKSLQLAKQSLAVKQKPNPKSIDLPTMQHFAEVAGRTIGALSQDVGQRVREHIEKHQLGPHGDRWLKYGVEHLTQPTCPFCDQDLAGLDLIAAYEAYFSEAFGQLLADRDQALADLSRVTTDDALKQLVAANTADFAFWAQVCELPPVPTITDDGFQTINDGLIALKSLFDRKTANPLTRVEFGEETVRIQAAFDLIANYNEVITRCIATIEAAKTAAQGADLPKAQRGYDQWLAMSDRRAEPIKSAAEGYAKSHERKNAITIEKKAAQNELTTYSKDVMKTRQQEINDLLEGFGANFRIVDAEANFKGREPNTDFWIGVGNSKLPAGEKSETEPSFKTVLSAGDKATLALAFFITQVRADANRNQAVVAFDDPFNSQDMDRQFETTSQIRAMSQEVCQTLVFSHDPRFLHMIERDSEVETRTFQLLCSDAGEGTLANWSSEDELKTLYIRQAEMIREFASQGKPLKGTTSTETLQAIRPFLEDYLRARFPGRFALADRLVPMIEAIEQAGKDDPLFGSVGDLQGLNEYTRRNMHGGGQVPNPVELRARCKKVFEIVGRW